MVDLKRRGQRMAEASSLGAGFPRFLERDENLARLMGAADAGTPPLAAIADDLAREFPQLRDDKVARSVVGTLIAAILDEQGYEVAATHVRLPKGSLFARGAVFRRKAEPVEADVLTRFVDALTEEEARRVVGQLRRRFPSLAS